MFFTAPLDEVIRTGTAEALAQNPELSHLLNLKHSCLSPLTLYIDNGLIAASAQDRQDTSKIVEVTFQEAHKWLTTRGLKIDQVKNELIHFTKLNRGRHSGEGPPVTIPTNMLGETKSVQPAKSIQYLGVWLDSCLNFSEHVQRTTTKAITAAHALKLLGNSIRGMHQVHARQIYIGAIHPIATYGVMSFWKSKNRGLLNLLTKMQNKALQMITGVFHTTNITAMEIKASIPPIDIWMDYTLNMEVLQISRLAENHPIVCHLYLEQHNHHPLTTPPPLPPFDNSKRHRSNPKTKLMTCIT